MWGHNQISRTSSQVRKSAWMYMQCSQINWVGELFYISLACKHMQSQVHNSFIFQNSHAGTQLQEGAGLESSPWWVVSGCHTVLLYLILQATLPCSAFLHCKHRGQASGPTIFKWHNHFIYETWCSSLLQACLRAGCKPLWLSRKRCDWIEKGRKGCVLVISTIFNLLCCCRERRLKAIVH